MDKDFIISSLFKKNLITTKKVIFKPMAGGVSSDICLLSDGVNNYVVKQACAKLKVKEDWFADVSRNETEQEFINYVQGFLPDAVPKIVFHDANRGFFVMEYMGSAFQNWKEQLLKGTFNPDTAIKAAQLISSLHLRSVHNEEVKKRFNSLSNFRSLRIEPYLVTTGDRHPGLKDFFYEEANRLGDYQEALVHGDFSPKNILVGPDRIVLLDHEVAWYGDPAFDVAFLLSHLYLKMLVHYPLKERPDLSRVFWKAYFEHMGEEKEHEMELRTGRLLIMLLLARMDGKSPVAYLNDQQKSFVRTFANDLLINKVYKQTQINAHWKSQLNQLPIEH
ncbi:MAG: phosphotransferase [Balneolales bacterium]